MEKPGRGGRREGAGRKPKSGENRIQKSVNLTPQAWAALAAQQQAGESESDTLERLLTAARLAEQP
jgi:hypothetical protein